MSTRRFHSVLLPGLILLLWVASPPARVARAEGPTGSAGPALKAAERNRLTERVRARLAAYQARALGAPGLARPLDPADQDRPARRGMPVTQTLVLPFPNSIVNNRAADTAPASGQCEESIASFGSNVVAAWNDGEGFATATSTQGYGYSVNDGLTWTDGGTPPATNVGAWTSDPVIAVNEKTGDFYYAALCEPS